ncbi:MAG TPA: fused MFS/spermidine synthase [Gemmatimonadaceae bacterium]|nr:fused MFS/spermidine synthase [Gemmatimonadaceae bacterium]
MTSVSAPAESREPRAESRRETRGGASIASGRLPLLLFTATIFTNALLLFVVQPMFSKLVLPYLGGTPAVWNTCLLFFQAVLLGGYAYAYLATRVLPARVQPAVHVGLLLLSLLALPIGIPPDLQAVVDASPVSWLLGLLTVSLGLPFFALSTGAPLLQQWFARTGHADADNPYFLYAASNLGSFVALLGYPFLVEPMLRLSQQTRWWSVAYAGLVLLVAWCAVLATRGARARPVAAAAHAATAEAAPSWRRRLRWVLLALVPSSLLVGLTTHLTTDVAAAPLLWVVPLALYLLTYVLAFARRPPIPHAFALRAQAVLLVPLLLAIGFGGDGSPWGLAPLHLLGFFFSALVLHGELARTRPAVSHLTEFYLWIALGGVLGSLVNVLVAPALFDRVLEYPIMLVAACALRPRLAPSLDEREEQEQRVMDIVLPFALAGLLLIAAGAADTERPLLRYGFVAVVTLGVFVFRARPLRFTLAAAALVIAPMLVAGGREGVLLVRERSFFGVYEVRRNVSYHVLTHGTTMHGAQSRLAAYRREPLTYYHRAGPLGQLFAVVGRPGVPRRTAVVGLGTGTTACYAKRGDAWTFYEIDPLVRRMALDTALFSYVHDCAPRARIVLGDARLELARAPDRSFDLIILDAFSSDAIPAHLLTREALAIYLRKLDEGGAIAFHISNRYLDLEPVLADLARDAGVAGVVGGDLNFTPAMRNRLLSRSYWVVLAPRAVDLRGLAHLPNWMPLPPAGGRRMWTDDYSNVLDAFRWSTLASSFRR